MDYLIVVIFFIIAALEWTEKGVPFNDIYFSHPELRKSYNWTPYYRQAATVLFALGISHLAYGLAISFHLRYLTLAGHFIIVVAMIYWLISQTKLPDIH